MNTMIIKNNFAMIETKNNDNSIWANVYQSISSSDKEVLFIDDEGNCTESTEDIRPTYTIYVCWRGCWDNRIYFPDDNEYFLEDIKDISKSIEYFELALKNNVIENGYGELD